MAGRLGRDESLSRLRAATPAILPSLLMCDFGNLQREIERVTDAGVPALHLDIMDGHFVPNLSYGLPLVEAIRRITDLPLDVHLMIERPQQYFARYCDAGADALTIHIEATEDPRPLLDEIRSLDAVAGIALNPPTPLSAIEASLPHCDLVLVMSVMPGFGGQSFDASAIHKLRELSSRRDCEALLEVDGGVNRKTTAECASAGAELFVVGSAIFGEPEYSTPVRELRELASTARRDSSHLSSQKVSSWKHTQ
jgi:ribulose-phosphate 3-epimerase